MSPILYDNNRDHLPHYGWVFIENRKRCYWTFSSSTPVGYGPPANHGPYFEGSIRPENLECTEARVTPVGRIVKWTHHERLSDDQIHRNLYSLRMLTEQYEARKAQGLPR